MSGKNSIQVGIKVRPLLHKEKDQQLPWHVVDNSIQLVENQAEPYTFDHIFDQDATNEIIFDKMAKQIVHSAIQGFNGTIFAYGQTSSGKTYTMMGDVDNPGVMVLAATEIFKQIEKTQDRQFLLRVGYIEIYNEKIYDLLNKKNQDLKIHETSTGVSVNCEEYIIRSEDDLLIHLNNGSKERTVGETNMNERSSRSHAIFRVIIESRKMDRSEDDAVIQSVINLVDLAGSERADQTGARGTRLKEGGHINKSLLFLSNVIKRLSENEDDKFISYRDSKLTRILQASLGGNALTAIICTIKPNAIEETQSTLSFALRAKAIKNKPQVNEIVSDATMMKRLEHEIKVLRTRLEEEQRKNESQIKVRQLEKRIKDEDLKIISCNSLHSIRSREKRRRTWCPSSTNLDASTVSTQQPSALPVPFIGSHVLTAQSQVSRLPAPKSNFYNTPLITMRPPPQPKSAPRFISGLPIPSDNLPDIEEEFAPAEMINFDRLSPLHTPCYQQLQRKFSLTPKLTTSPRSTLEKVELDFMELQNFTDLENKVDVKHDVDLALKQEVKILKQRNVELEKDRLEYLQLRDEFTSTKDNLTETQHLCDEQQIHISKLSNKNKIANEKIAKYEAELAELKKINEKLEMENRETVNLEFEFQRHKNKSKLRENELIEALNDKDKEITKLEKSLNLLGAERLQNSKEELLQKSVNESNDKNEVCVKCEDIQRLLEENKKLSLEFQKLTLLYESLKLNYADIEKENITSKTKIKQLEELQQKETAECEKLLVDVKILKESLHKVQNNYELLSSENSSKHEECKALNRQVEEAREEMVKLEEKFSKLELSWQGQQQTINDIEAQYANIQRKYEQLNNQYEELEACKGKSQTDCQRLEQQNVKLQSEIEELKEKVQDAQHRLLESNEYEETAKETKTANDETWKIQQENVELKNQLLEIQTQFDGMQKEYDDLSNQLMDNLQDNETLRSTINKLLDKFKELKEQNDEVWKAETEINELKTVLEIAFTNEKKSPPKTPSPEHYSSMRSSGLCCNENENNFEDFHENSSLLRKFSELSESLTEIELEHSKGKIKTFKSASRNSTPNNYKMYLKNIMGVSKIQKQFDMEIENIHLQGSFKNHSFHIVEMSGEENNSSKMECDTSYINNGCENMAEYIEKLKQEINELKTTYERERLTNKSLIESTERACSEMREQITQLSAELLEKSIFVENCACKAYQQQIENLEKEKTDITIACEELQERVNCTINGSFDMLPNTTCPGAAALTEDNLKELEELRLKEQEFESQIMILEDLTQRCIDKETELEMVREELEQQQKDSKQKYNELQLELLQKLELSANEYKRSIKEYNETWEERVEVYEQTIKELKKQKDDLKGVKGEDLQSQIKQATNVEEQKDNLEEHKEDREEPKERLGELVENLEEFQENPETQSDNHLESEVTPAPEDLEMPVDIESIKQDKFRLEQENTDLRQQLSTAEEFMQNLREENRTQYVEITHLHSRIVSLQEHLNDIKVLHATSTQENHTLENQIEDLEEHLDCLPQLQNRNQELSDELNKLKQEFLEIKEKLQEAEKKIQETSQEDSKSQELMQTKLTHITTIEEEKERLANELENLKEEHLIIQGKLLNTEQQIQELCSEDEKREQIIQKLQQQLNNMTSLEEEKTILQNDCKELKETLNTLKQKDIESNKEIDVLNQKLKDLQNIFSDIKFEKSNLEEKLQQINSEYNLLQTDQVLMETELKEITEERKSINEQCLQLQEEKTMMEKQLKDLQDNLSDIKFEKSNLEEKLQQINSEYNLLKTDQILMETELKEITEERKSLNEQCLQLQEEKTMMEEQLKCLREKENTEELLGEMIKEKAELVQNLRLTTEKLEEALEQLQIKENEVVNANEMQAQMEQSLKTLEESLNKIIEEKQQRLEETEREKENFVQNNKQLNHELGLLKQNFTKINEEHLEQLNEMDKFQQENSQLKDQFTKLEQEKQKYEQNLENVQQELESLKDTSSKIMEEKQEEYFNLVNNHQTLQKHNQELQHQLQELLQTQTTKYEKQLQEMKKLEKDKYILQEQLSKLNQEKQEHQNNLEKAQQEHLQLKETLSNAFKEKEQKLLYLENNHQSKEKQNLELQQQIKTLTQALKVSNEERQQLISIKQTIEEDWNTTKQFVLKLQEEKKKLEKQLFENLQLQKELSHLKENLQAEQSSLKHELQELQQKFEALQVTNTQLRNHKEQLEQHLQEAKEKLKLSANLPEELNILKLQNTELQQNLKETEEEAGRCSLALRQEIEKLKQLLEEQLRDFNKIKQIMESQKVSLNEKNLELSSTIETLQNEKLSLEEKLKEISIRHFEQDLQRLSIDATANTSTSSTTSIHSSKERRSLGSSAEFKSFNTSVEEKLSAIQQKEKKNLATAERKNRRLSTHDERRRQSCWGTLYDKETMTESMNKNCNCVELERKVKECEREIFIKNSQVTALNMEIKNHPLKEENAALMKRLKDEQEKHLIEIKRFKTKLCEQISKTEKAVATAAHVTAKSQHAAVNAALAAEQQTTNPILLKVLADAETQTNNELSESFIKLQGKNEDLKKICRNRYNVIKELEEKIKQNENFDGSNAQFNELKKECDVLKKELITLQEKYECAKKVLHARREEITYLRSQLEKLAQ